MGVNIAQYRVAIGMFNHAKIKLVLIDFHIIYICKLGLQLMLCYFIIFKLLCSGDVEVNPGPNKLKFLRTCHINIRSLCKDKLRAIKVICGQYDIITLSETHLDPTGTYDHLKLDGFHNIVRKDRTRGGGGVAIYVRDCIPFKRRFDFECNGIEAVWLQVNTLEGKILICSAYRPPTQYEFWDNFSTSLDLVKEDAIKYMFILGDLNANFNTYQGNKLEQFCNAHNLSIHNHECTRITPTSATVLDQLLSNVPTFVRSIHVDPPVSTNDHSTLSAILNFKLKHDSAYERLIWDFKRADFTEFRKQIEETNWDHCFETEDIDIASKRWSETLLNLARTCIPNKVVIIRPRDSPWFSTRLHKLKRKVHRAYAAVKQNFSAYRWEKYNVLKHSYLDELKESERLYHDKLAKSLSQERNTSGWWSTLKHVLGKGDDSSYPPLKSGDDYITDNKDKAELFNSFFINNSNIDTSNAALPDFNYLTDQRLEDLVASEAEVLDLVKSLQVNKSTGHDGIGPKMLREAGSAIVPSLTQLINMSLQSSKVPADWKKAQVIPIFKKNSQDDPNNYRPISILPTVSKIAERIVFKHVYNYFHEHSLLTRDQSCVPGDSTVNQLAFLYNHFCHAIDEKKDIQIVFCDIKKAFEKVWFKGLLFKLKQLGISGNLLNWFGDYLSERYQRVGIKGQNSEWKLIPAGVPQGSVLGPLLFLVYIGDLVENIHCNIKLYADDTTLYITTDDLQEGSAALNEDLTTINNWAYQWLVTFCPNKTVYMHMSLKKNKQQAPPVVFDGKQLTEIQHHKHLGVTLTNNLTWSEHITNLSRGVGKCLDAMKKLKHSLDRQSLDTVYITFIRPKLEYANIIFHDCTDYDRDILENLQLDAARIVTGAKRGTSHELIYRECGWPLLSERREQNQLIQLYKMKHNETPPYLSELVPPSVGDSVRHVNLRNKDKLRSIRCRTAKYQKSFLPNAVNAWNDLENNIIESDCLSTFKCNIVKSSKCKEIYMYGPRKFSMIHAQFRMKCSNLKSHLHALHVMEDESCVCGYRYEDNAHFLLLCPMYDEVRTDLINFCTECEIEFTVENLLYGIEERDLEFNKMLFSQVHTFIELTKRF